MNANSLTTGICPVTGHDSTFIFQEPSEGRRVIIFPIGKDVWIYTEDAFITFKLKVGMPDFDEIDIGIDIYTNNVEAIERMKITIVSLESYPVIQKLFVFFTNLHWRFRDFLGKFPEIWIV